MESLRTKPRILIVTPEVTYLPDGMGNATNYLKAKAGGLADVSAALISALFEQGADVHVAMPDYRRMFIHGSPELYPGRELESIRAKMPDDRVHLAEDRAFFYVDHVYANYSRDNLKIALAFQREVINNIVPRVRPDLIHCNDWMTGLVPAMTRMAGIPCLFTLHNIHTVTSTLAEIEDRGIDAAYFWQHLYYRQYTDEYEAAREAVPVDFVTSGVFAAHFVNTVSPTFLKEIVDGRHGFVDGHLQRELRNKYWAGCAAGILNAPDPSFRPDSDTTLPRSYGPKGALAAKRENKRHLQQALGLIVDDKAPLFFWPHRLDPIQKGCQLLSDILYRVVSMFWAERLQVVFVANGAYQQVFRDIVAHHHFQQRVAVCDFNGTLERQAYAAADFMLMPSRFEPCGLPQMIAPIYGALPVAHDTGGIHDTITHLNVDANTGNGFLFEVFDSQGLFWAIEQAMAFHRLPGKVRAAQISRIMLQSQETFTHTVTARRYIELYEKMLERPLIVE
jgi:starch synthase/alpha-amylase